MAGYVNEVGFFLRTGIDKEIHKTGMLHMKKYPE
jgi:hypothetical protein